jgi:hypothetical protein
MHSFSGTIFFIVWSSFKSAAAEAAPEAPQVNPAVERLEQIERELPFKTAARNEIRKSVRELRERRKDPRTSVLPDGMHIAVGAMTMLCPHATLEASQRKADADVDALLWERAQLRMKFGFSR